MELAASDLIDVTQRSVSTRVLNDESVYRREMESLFSTRWNCVAHVTEIQEPGSYVVRRIGDQSVIVARGRAGAINVLKNQCRHRSMTLCIESGGQRPNFECPYHGWTYDLDGELVGVTAEKHMYEDLDKGARGLDRYAVETRWGFIFARPAEASGPSFAEFLSEAGWYMDIMFARSKSGLQVHGAPQRWEVPANWKLPAEQFATDGYHVLRLHKSMIELGLLGKVKPDYRSAGLYGIDIATSFGHGFRCVDLTYSSSPLAKKTPVELEQFRLRPPPGMSPDMVDQLQETLDDAQRRTLFWDPPMIGQIFPNMAVMSMYMPTADLTMGEIISVRTWNPRGPDRTEILSWVLVETDASPEVQERTIETTIRNFGMSGLFEEDDAETWVRIQSGLGRDARGAGQLSYDAVLGEKRPENWAGPGKVFAGPSRDDNQWEFWLEWARALDGAPQATGSTRGCGG
jgi:phenylpropionate dioxygenase-like ring-hydroxylating dioxygenase large terminal subunit